MSPKLVDPSGDLRATFLAALEFGIHPGLSPGYPAKIDHEYVGHDGEQTHSDTCPCGWRGRTR